MKTLYLGAALGTVLALNSVAFAQTPAAPAPAAPAPAVTAPAATTNSSATVVIAPADQTKFSAWVVAEKKASATAPAGFTVKVGEVLPATVTIYEIPATAGVASLTKYRYVSIGGKTVLVDPASRKIVHILG